MTAVVIGVDPAKRTYAMAVLDQHEEQLAALQVANDSAGYRAMLTLAKRWKNRVWAVEGAGGVGVQLAQRLVADGETVLDVPPKPSTRARIFDRGHGRKNDPADARTTAVVALRTKGLREVVLDDEMVALRLMSEDGPARVVAAVPWAGWGLTCGRPPSSGSTTSGPCSDRRTPSRRSAGA